MKRLAKNSKIGWSVRSVLMSCVLIVGATQHAADAAIAQFGRCVIRENVPIHPMTTTASQSLTIAVPLPSPGAYQGNTPESIDGGYLYCLGAEIAHRAGLRRVVVKNASFESLVTGKATDFDMSIWDLFPTPERKKSVDFSDGYRFTDTGVIVRAGSDVTQANIRDAKLGVLLGSVQEKFVRETLKPKSDIRVFQSNDDMWAALMARQIDAALTDTETVMPRAEASHGLLKVVGRYHVGGDVAILFPKGSSEVAPTNQILDDMRKDGSLKAIQVQWLDPSLGGKPADIPEWKAN